MNQGDDVESIFNRVTKSYFLVASIPLIHGIMQEGQGEWHLARAFQIMRPIEGLISRGVVDDQEFRVVTRERSGDPADDLLNGSLRIVGHDENQDPFFVAR